MITKRAALEMGRCFAPAVAFLALLGVILRWDHIDWGDAPGWLGALLTGGALIYAARTYARDQSRRRDAENRLARAAEFAESEQARQVHIYIEGRDLVVHNRSDYQIDALDVWGKVYDVDVDRAERVGPFPQLLQSWQMVGPHKEERFPELPEMELAVESRFNLQAKFIDAASRYWHLVDGHLTQKVGLLPWEGG